MLEHYIRSRRVLDRLQCNPLRDLIERFSDYLYDRGYAVLTAQSYLQAAEHYGNWLGSQPGRSLVIDGATTRAFVTLHLPECNCPKPAVRSMNAIGPSLRHLLAIAREHGDGPPPVDLTPADLLVQKYLVHLDVNGGLAEETRHYRERYAREFLQAHEPNGSLKLDTLTPDDVLRFVTGYARRCKRSSAQVAACSLRSFLRFLHQRGHCAENLVRAVPRVPQWKQEDLPKTMTDDQLSRFLASFDQSSIVGSRDYALALFMVDLGLRVSEVVDLVLDDFDWRAGTFRVHSRKERRERMLPLPSRVGRAIVRYLKSGRPVSHHRQLFLRHSVPVGEPVTLELVRGAIRRAFERADFPPSWTGTHILRHTAATLMHQRGVPQKNIADVLGHQSIETSVIYTRVNRTRLATVALPWPEERS